MKVVKIPTINDIVKQNADSITAIKARQRVGFKNYQVVVTEKEQSITADEYVVYEVVNYRKEITVRFIPSKRGVRPIGRLSATIEGVPEAGIDLAVTTEGAVDVHEKLTDDDTIAWEVDVMYLPNMGLDKTFTMIFQVIATDRGVIEVEL